MIPAKLIKNLEKIGFELDFPGYGSTEEFMRHILRQDNSRLDASIPLLIKKGFDYRKLKSLDAKRLGRLNKIIKITDEILLQEKEDNTTLKTIIKENDIKEKFSRGEFDYFYNAYKETEKRYQERQDTKIASEIKARSRLTVNKALANIYSPAKRRIMDKIFNHEILTNTELKYYYRAIRPINRAILNDNMREYVRIIENTRKRK